MRTAVLELAGLALVGYALFAFLRAAFFVSPALGYAVAGAEALLGGVLLIRVSVELGARDRGSS